MHRSRLAGFIIDCKGGDLEAAAAFWSAALDMPLQGGNNGCYVSLDARTRDIHLEVQRVDHDSRIHLDIESDDTEAEVQRLERLGARRVSQGRTWWILEAPTGHRFCVVPASDLSNAAGVSTWP